MNLVASGMLITRILDLLRRINKLNFLKVLSLRIKSVRKFLILVTLLGCRGWTEMKIYL